MKRFLIAYALIVAALATTAAFLTIPVLLFGKWGALVYPAYLIAVMSWIIACDTGEDIW